jgi:membrane-bound lytic murein transglycosylase D
MTRIIFLTIFFSGPYLLGAQNTKVPSRMEFAGIKLRIMDDAREEIQKDVDALTASPKYFEIKAERARTYFPIIERIFKEENLPDDFKYLCLQESALISDAVSSSDAVGFWQFKDFSAMEVGMRVDKYVDERMNIVASTRGAAKYLHNNNQHFDNWLHALQAYQMGAGGAMKVLDNGHEGSKSMVINKKTYWYVKKFLAHKIAFEGSTNQKGMIEISEYYNGSNRAIKDIANETGVSEDEISTYNKWLKKGKVPDDKKYAVIIPRGNMNTELVATTIAKKTVKDEKVTVEYLFDKPGDFPKIEDEIDARAGKIVDINGLPGIVAGRNDRIPELADKAGISLHKFLKYNDMGIDGRLVPGQVYYMKAKRSKAKAYNHVAQTDETLWSVSQKFGLKLKKLKLKNRYKEDFTLIAGRVLWLRYIRPSNVDIEYKEVTQIPKPVVASKSEIINSSKIEEMDTLMNAMIDSDSLNIQKETKEIETVEIAEIDSFQINELNIAESTNFEEDIDEPEIEDDEQDKILKIHEVALGETYYAISKLYTVSVINVLKWNNLKISDKLSIGQKLNIYVDQADNILPNLTASNASTLKYHIVKEGETLYQISKIYKVNIQELMRLNNMADTDIRQGEKLKIVD